MKIVKHKWAKGPVMWSDGDTAYISVVFSWDVGQVLETARKLTHVGMKVRVGGPGVHVKTEARTELGKIARIGGSIDDAVVRHNPSATFASRGCPVGCWFCIVPSLEGREFTLIDNFPVRPVLCDNNLSALPVEFQDHIVLRYLRAGVPLLDANSGFEPRAFDEDTYHRWKPIMKGPWRFAYDDEGDGPDVERMMKILEDVSSKRKRVYVLIGNQPFEQCMERIHRVLAWGGEPHVQAMIKLNASEKKPWVRYDWTDRKLRDVQRWANRYLWKYVDFDGYDRSIRTGRRSAVDVRNMGVTL